MEKIICDGVDYIISQINSDRPSLDGIRAGIAQLNANIDSFRLAECSSAISGRIDLLCKDLINSDIKSSFIDVVEMAAKYGKDSWRFVHLANYYIRYNCPVPRERLTPLLPHTLESWEFCYLLCVIIDSGRLAAPMEIKDSSLQRQILAKVEKFDNFSNCYFLCKIAIRTPLYHHVISDCSEPLRRIHAFRRAYGIMSRLMDIRPTPASLFKGTGKEGIRAVNGPSFLDIHGSTVFLWMNSRDLKSSVVAVGQDPVLGASAGLTAEFTVSNAVLLLPRGVEKINGNWKFTFLSAIERKEFGRLIDGSSSSSLSSSPLEVTIVTSSPENTTRITSPTNEEYSQIEFSQQVARVPDVRLVEKIQQAKAASVSPSANVTNTTIPENEKTIPENERTIPENERTIPENYERTNVDDDSPVEFTGPGIHMSPIPQPTAYDDDATTISLEDAYFGNNQWPANQWCTGTDVPVLMLPRNVDEINRSVKYELLRKVDEFLADLTRVEVAVLAKKRVALTKLSELRSKFSTHRVRK